MIIRLSHKLRTRVKLGRLQPQGLAESSIIDWSARSFRVGRVEYILWSNTGSLYSCVMPSKGINSDSQLVAAAMIAIREKMVSDGWETVFDRFIAPSRSSVTFATALSRTITSSMNELEDLARWALAGGETSLSSVAGELNDHILSALADDKQLYRTPKDVMGVLCAQLTHDKGSRETSIDFSAAGKAATAESPVEVGLPQSQRRILAELLPKWEGKFESEKTHWRVATFALGELQEILETARNESKRCTGARRRSLEGASKTIAKATDKAQGIQATSTARQVYQFKITLLGLEPPIWRRIQISDCTLDKLHEHIQAAMGWTNSHLHQFHISGERYGDPELLDDGFESRAFSNSRVAKLSQILPEGKKQFRFVYEYDFGDDWKHEIAFEGSSDAQPGERYPVCLDGARACPPEDSGGIWGYVDLLEALADPAHEEHEEFLEWAGPIDPEAFDCQKATRRMRQGLPNWRT